LNTFKEYASDKGDSKDRSLKEKLKHAKKALQIAKTCKKNGTVALLTNYWSAT